MMNSSSIQKLSPTMQLGFTAIEVVVVIVVSSILAFGFLGFITRSAESLTSATARNQLATSGRVALDRIALELHNALPNSIRVKITSFDDQCIEFIPVKAATTYVNPSFTGAGTLAFNVIDFKQGATTVYPAAPPTLYAVIYPRRQAQIYNGDIGAQANWPNFPTSGPIETIASIAASGTGNLSTVTLAPVLPVTTHRFNRRSPNQRLFVVSDPVSFCVKTDKLYRYSNYGFFTAQVSAEEVGSNMLATPPLSLPNYEAGAFGRVKTLITDSIDNTINGGVTAFTVGNQSLSRNSLVVISLNFTNGEDSVIINHEVMTRSVP